MLRHLVRALTFALLVSAAAAPAAGATTFVRFEIGTYPAGAFDYPNDAPRTDTGYYGGSIYADDRQIGRHRIELVRGGAVVPVPASRSGLSVLPGDVVRLVRTADGAVLAQTTVEANPALDASSCIGQNGFSGTRTGDAAVTVRSLAPFQQFTGSGRYSNGTNYRRADRPGRVRSLGTGTFAGTFDAPIAAGDLLGVSQTVETTSGDTETTVTTTNWRYAAACPRPVPDTTAPTSTSFDLGSTGTTLRQFLKFGLTSFVGISEPGTVSQELYLANGAKLPASAAAKTRKKAKKKPKRAVLLGKARTSLGVTGVARVVVKASKTGRRALRGRRSAKVVLITTIRDTSGNATTLKPRSLTLTAG